MLSYCSVSKSNHIDDMSSSRMSNITNGKIILKKRETLPGRMMYISGRWMTSWRELIMPTRNSIEPVPAIRRFRASEKMNVIYRIWSVDLLAV